MICEASRPNVQLSRTGEGDVLWQNPIDVSSRTGKPHKIWKRDRLLMSRVVFPLVQVLQKASHRLGVLDDNQNVHCGSCCPGRFCTRGVTIVHFSVVLVLYGASVHIYKTYLCTIDIDRSL